MVQGSDLWIKCRLGIPSASCFDKIITPTGKESEQADGYMMKLLAEIITGKPTDFEQTEWMIRGNEMEEEAMNFYSFQNDVELEKVGFITNDEGTMGCSPDRLLGEDGLVECKNPAPHTHVRYILTGKLDSKYKPQLQGQLYIAEREFVDIISYQPDMASIVIRNYRDEGYISTMKSLLDKFVDTMAHKKQALMEKGYLTNQGER